MIIPDDAARSFDEVVEITGYTRAQVAWYLPEGIGRIK